MKKSRNRPALRRLIPYLHSSRALIALLVVLTLLLSAVTMGVSICMKLYLDIASSAGQYTTWQVTALALVTITLIGALQLGIGCIRAKVISRTELAIRTGVIENAYIGQYPDVESTGPNAYLTRLTSDAQIASEFVPDVLVGYMMQEIAMMLLSIALMFALSRKLTVLFCVLVPVLMLIIIKSAGGIEKQIQHMMACEEDNRRLMTQLLQRNVVFRLYGVFREKLRELSASYAEKSRARTRLGLMKGVVEFLNNFMGIGLFVLALGAGTHLALKNEITIGDTVAIVNLISYLYGPFIHVTDWIAKTGEARSAAGRIADIQRNVPTQTEDADISGAQELSARGLRFGYTQEKEVLCGLSLTLQRGEITGITGQNGCGKTTLTYLLIGLYPMQGGTLLADGREIPGIRREDIAYMPNRPQLFQGTILENVLMGQPFDAERWDRAARDSGLTDVLAALPKGAETSVSEENSNFSSGQLQRINLARAFYRDAALYVLDEPDSYLTQQAIAELMDVLKARAKDRFVLIISHEEAVLNTCDRLYRMENGELLPVHEG